jgi:hypothetical protein
MGRVRADGSRAPEPVAYRQGDTLWIAYLANAANFPGWEHTTALEYVDRLGGQEAFGVLKFDGVTHQQLGPPSDERCRSTLYGARSRLLLVSQGGSRARVVPLEVTFHDETLEVTARNASASPLIFASNALEAIEKARR